MGSQNFHEGMPPIMGTVTEETVSPADHYIPGCSTVYPVVLTSSEKDLRTCSNRDERYPRGKTEIIVVPKGRRIRTPSWLV